jgi:hypothetical protein
MRWQDFHYRGSHARARSGHSRKSGASLISLLRKRGFTVKPIAGPDDIKSNFLSPSWSDRVRSWLERF